MDSSRERSGITAADLCRSHLGQCETHVDKFLAPVRLSKQYDQVTEKLGGRPAHVLVASYLCSLVDKGVGVYAGGGNGPLELCTGIGLGFRVTRALPKGVYVGTILEQIRGLKEAFQALIILRDLFSLDGQDSLPSENSEVQNAWRLATAAVTLSDLLLREYQERITERLILLIGAQDIEIYIKGKPIEKIYEEVLAALGIPESRHTLLFSSRNEVDPTQIGLSCELGELAHGQQGIKIRVAEFSPSKLGPEPLLLRPFWRVCIQAFPNEETLKIDRSLGPGATNISQAALARLVNSGPSSKWVPAAKNAIEWTTDDWGRRHALVEADLEYIKNEPSLVVNLAFELVYQAAMRSVWSKDAESLAEFAKLYFVPATLTNLLKKCPAEIAEKIVDNCASKLASDFSQSPIETLALILPQEVFDALSPAVKEILVDVLGVNATYGIIRFITGDSVPDIEKVNALFIKLTSLHEAVNPLSYGIDGFFEMLEAFGWDGFYNVPDSIDEVLRILETSGWDGFKAPESSVPLFRFFDTWQTALHGGTPTRNSRINVQLPEAVKQAIYFIRGVYTHMVSTPEGVKYASKFLSSFKALGLDDVDLAALPLEKEFDLAKALEELFRKGLIEIGTLVPKWQDALDKQSWRELDKVFGKSNTASVSRGS